VEPESFTPRYLGYLRKRIDRADIDGADRCHDRDRRVSRFAVGGDESFGT
jgi:hypothetical protein